MLPMELPPILSASGFSSFTRQNLSYVDTALHAGFMAKLIVNFVTSQDVTEEDAELWFSQLINADKEGRFGFVHFPVLTVATTI